MNRHIRWEGEGEGRGTVTQLSVCTTPKFGRNLYKFGQNSSTKAQRFVKKLCPLFNPNYPIHLNTSAP